MANVSVTPSMEQQVDAWRWAIGTDIARSLLVEVGATNAIKTIRMVEEFGAERVERWIRNLADMEGLPAPDDARIAAVSQLAREKES